MPPDPTIEKLGAGSDARTVACSVATQSI